MASFQKRGKTWQYTISNKGKPIRKGGFKTKKEAQIAAAEIEASMNKGIQVNIKSVPFDEYFESWIEAYKTNIANNTLERYKVTLKTIKQKFAGVPIQNITKRDYQLFLNEYAKSHAKASTRKLNTHIRACVKDAIDEGYIQVDFTRGAVLSGAVAAKKPDEKHLNYFESKRLMKELADPQTLTEYLIILGMASGMRFAEMVGLTRKDFDFLSNTINIDKTWGYTKKMHDGFGPTKNEQSVRKIKMDQRTMDLFKDMFKCTPDNVHGLVFFSPHSKYKVISNDGVNKVLKNRLKKLNIDPITVHGLRHTHASILLYKNVSIYYVSERLGHGDVQTTISTYAHIIKELREQDEKNTIKVFESFAQ